MASRRVPVHEYLVLDREPDPPAFACRDCEAPICAWDENYRLHAVRVDTSTAELGPLFVGLQDSIDERIVLRAYHCPSCGRRLDAEVCPESAEPLWDIKLASPDWGGAVEEGAR